MNEIEIQVLIIQCQIKGLYETLKKLAEIPCPDCGKEVIIGGTTYYPWPGNIAVPPKDSTGNADFIRCQTCGGTGKRMKQGGDDVLDLNRLVR